MHCARRTEHRVWQNLDALDAFGLDSTIACTVSLCVDRRIVSPDARGMLVQTIWALLREEVRQASPLPWSLIIIFFR